MVTSTQAPRQDHASQTREHSPSVDERAVFLNVPYDRGYERLFLALVAVLIALGRKPRCTLELPDFGQGRPDRILEILRSCRMSFHDLSRAGTPARHNMAFELGLAYALRELRGSHDVVLLEARPHRLDRTLSDLKKTDHHVHDGKPQVVISCVLDVLGEGAGDPDPAAVLALYRRLARTAQDIKARYARETLYYAAVYRAVLGAGTTLARKAGLLSAAAQDQSI